MRLLADENIPAASVHALRDGGHDVVWVAETLSGATDQVVLRKAAEESRLRITFDRDFGALVYRNSIPSPAGIVLLRIIPNTPEEPGSLLLDLLTRAELTFERQFTVVDREHVRQRPLARTEGGDLA